MTRDDEHGEDERIPGLPARRGRAVWPLVVSVLAHGTALSAVAAVAYGLAARDAREANGQTAPPSEVIAVELPVFDEGTLRSDHDPIPEGARPSARGGARVARVDTGARGRGGQATGAPAINLADADEAMRLSPDLVSRLDRDQHQRLRTAAVRGSREDRRATTRPMELTFLATGAGEHQERRAVAQVDPSRGSLSSPRPSVEGGRPGTRAVDEIEGPGASGGAARPGELTASPGLGVRDGRPGDDHRAAARVATGRPAVVEGPVTIPAATRARPSDTVDSDQEVASTVRSLVHASVAGGLAGLGRGGTAGPVEPASGGESGRGSIARPLGTGEGEIVDWYTNDPMLLPYFRKIHAKVDPLWRDAFPRSAMLELKQGTVILEFTIEADGSARVSWPPLRPSGIDEFDRNCADAIRRASPFEPIPPSLRQAGRSRLRIRAPFVASNPIVK